MNKLKLIILLFFITSSGTIFANYSLERGAIVAGSSKLTAGDIQDHIAVGSAIAGSQRGGAFTNDILIFSGSALLPIVFTGDLIDTTIYTARINSDILETGVGGLIKRGIVYSTSPDPVIGSADTSLVANSFGVLTNYIRGLKRNTLYYYRAFASSAGGTVYGVEDTVLTPNKTITVDFAANACGLAPSPLIANSQNQIIFGFIATDVDTGYLHSFNMKFDQDSANLASNLKNFRLYRSSNSYFDYSNSGQNSFVSNGVLSSSGIKFTYPSNVLITNSPLYYFVVADVSASASSGSASLTPVIVHSSIISYDVYGIQIDQGQGDSSLSIKRYDFIGSLADISVENQAPAGILGIGVSNQKIFAFKMSSQNKNSIKLNTCKFIIEASDGLSINSLSNWRLWYDENENGFPDINEQSFIGTYSSGTLTFPLSAQSQEFTNYRKYLLTVNIDRFANSASTLKASIPDISYITMQSPASVSGAGPWIGNTQVLQMPSGEAKLALSPEYKKNITTGESIALTYQLQDEFGVPANASSSINLTLNTNGATIISNNTGILYIGNSFLTINAKLDNLSGIVGESISCSNSTNLTAPNPANGISISPNLLPTFDISAAPLSVSNQSDAFMVNYDASKFSSPRNVIILMRANSTPKAPTNGQAYDGLAGMSLLSAANANLVETGTFVLYSGANANQAFSISDISPNTNYYFTVYGYESDQAELRNYLTELNRYNPIIKTSDANSNNYSKANTQNTARQIEDENEFSSVLEQYNDAHWYKFTIGSIKQNVLLKLTNITKNNNLNLYLYNDLNLIRSSSFTVPSNRLIIINNLLPGNYFVKITGNLMEGSNCSYKLKILSKDKRTPFFSQPN